MLKLLSLVGVVAAVMGLVFFFIMFVSPIAVADQGLVRCEQAGQAMISNTACPAGFTSSPIQLHQATTYKSAEVSKAGDRLHRVIAQTDTDTDVARQRSAIRGRRQGSGD